MRHGNGCDCDACFRDWQIARHLRKGGHLCLGCGELMDAGEPDYCCACTTEHVHCEDCGVCCDDDRCDTCWSRVQDAELAACDDEDDHAGEGVGLPVSAVDGNGRVVTRFA